MNEKLRMIRYKLLIFLIDKLDNDPDMPPGLRNALRNQLPKLIQARDSKKNKL